MPRVTTIRIGTRKSALAMAQAHEVRNRLMAAWPHLAAEGAITLVPMTTSGDRFTARPLAEIGGKGLFTKELEEGLLDGGVDIAVHSMKDMPTELPPGLIIGCILEREDPRDMLVGNQAGGIEALPEGAVFGTASLRRSAQLLLKRPDLRIVPLRGNVQTRLAKLEQGEMDATMLACAGLNRLGLRDVTGVPLAVETFLPAVAQGAIGIECQQGNPDILELLQPLAHAATTQCVLAERAMLRVLDGSCRTPIAGYADIQNGQLRLRGMVIAPDGSSSQHLELSGNMDMPDVLGQELGKQLSLRAHSQ